MQNRQKLRTVLVGFGKIAQGNASDSVMAKRMPYSTHAQVLEDHPLYEWKAVVDPRAEIQKLANEEWRISEVVSQISDLKEPEQYDVAIISTPPSSRPDVLGTLPKLKGILLEKPMAESFSAASTLVSECKSRGIALQINMLRRADKTTRQLANAELDKTIGCVQTAFGVYSNGLMNNGTHMIDLARMLIRQEIRAVQAIGRSFSESPISGDINVAFNLHFESGLTLAMAPLKLSCYRENGLELWGECGRLSYLNSGFSIRLQSLKHDSLVSGESELDLENGTDLASTMGSAFWEMYSNLADAIQLNEPLASPGTSALRTMEVVEALIKSVRQEDPNTFRPPVSL